ncbi:MAG: nucleotide exchange factor GrpE [Verrucomicrobia bacterium]|nr:nucleotide exchange factor GrpE [Verrucomicrobiota bacterium]MCF7708569.1 nucleotide exchange factor GrpE [Verrucomicrobiota bacterium]
MKEESVPKLVKWPFFVGDAVLLALACWILYQCSIPAKLWELSAAAVCVFGGAVLAIIPYLKEYRTVSRLTEAAMLEDTTKRFEDVGKVGESISMATAQWQSVEDNCKKAVVSSEQVVNRIAAEAKAFAEFLQNANDQERKNLRLEIEKLKRSEADWLQVLVRILDHVFALYQAGEKSNQPALIEQLTLFQNACRDIARRVGLVPFIPEAGEPYSEKIHQLPDPEARPSAGSTVSETLATGFTFQGELLRPALVVVSPEPVKDATSTTEDIQSPELETTSTQSGEDAEEVSADFADQSSLEKDDDSSQSPAPNEPEGEDQQLFLEQEQAPATEAAEPERESDEPKTPGNVYEDDLFPEYSDADEENSGETTGREDTDETESNRREPPDGASPGFNRDPQLPL